MILIILAILTTLVLLTTAIILIDVLIENINKYYKESPFKYGNSKYKEIVYER